MAASDGDVVVYGGRPTYFPPFLHQALNQCTMTAGLMAANVAFCGTLKSTTEEVERLGEKARPFPSGGYNTRDLLKALDERWQLKLRNENVLPDIWRRRLGNGWVVILGFSYPDLRSEFRAPGFTSISSDHRVLAVGYDPVHDKTRMLDPLQRGTAFRGIDVPIKHLHDIVSTSNWADWQVWIKEGQRVLTTLTIRSRFDPVRTATLHGNGTRTFDFWDALIPGAPVRSKRPSGDLSVPFDASGRFRQSDSTLEPAGGVFVRVAEQTPPTGLDGLWFQVTSQVDADTDPDGNATTRNIASATDTGFADGLAAGIVQERNRWLRWLEESPDVTPPPNSDPGMGEGVGG